VLDSPFAEGLKVIATHEMKDVGGSKLEITLTARKA
jgi:hypothetical protein